MTSATWFEVSRISANQVAYSISSFVLAGLCEIGGGWLVWRWLREGKGFPWGLAGAVILILYGIIPTYQPAHFGRIYAAYGGFFILLSLICVKSGVRPFNLDRLEWMVECLNVNNTEE